MARTEEQIYAELGTSYQPQKDLYNKQISGVDPALAAEEQGLQAQKEDSFRGITEQANRRGLFYSGVPIQEQARYTGGQFLPALANLRGKYYTQKTSLTEALNQLGMQQGQEARNIRQTELANDESARRFNREQEARDRAAASAAQAAQFQFGGGGGGNPAAPAAPATSAVPPELQALSNRMFNKPGGGQYSDDDLARDYERTMDGARRGNQNDIQKLQIYHTSPRSRDLFGADMPNIVPYQQSPQFNPVKQLRGNTLPISGGLQGALNTAMYR